ncbi:hypothetical protein OFY73_004778 [Salmonella enterica]|nr:hypothetical protein [Salmonella enterica]EJA5011257.1 hypothetical protein [Salmonella enterica]EJA5049327.1 hypothetical protein [Salmonella enterica]EJA5115318.1 hypothetical protein [Salmonella enterica]EJA5478480.1 hypothetical protein [Salmonella enterica]
MLKLAQDKMDELERQDKRRSKSMPKRRAQARILEQRRVVNPVFTNPDASRNSLKQRS